jgi:cell shape-determining protein MreC
LEKLFITHSTRATCGANPAFTFNRSCNQSQFVHVVHGTFPILKSRINLELPYSSHRRNLKPMRIRNKNLRQLKSENQRKMESLL